MSGAPTVTIAGAGVLGLASALALARAGCAVTVCDPGGPDNASTVAAGMIAPVFEAVLDAAAGPHFHLLMAGRDLWPGLAARTGVALGRARAPAGGPGDRVGAGAARAGGPGPAAPGKPPAAGPAPPPRAVAQ